MNSTCVYWHRLKSELQLNDLHVVHKTYIPDNSILQATVFSFKKPLMKKYSAQVTLLETLNLSIKTLS